MFASSEQINGDGRYSDWICNTVLYRLIMQPSTGSVRSILRNPTPSNKSANNRYCRSSMAKSGSLKS